MSPAQRLALLVCAATLVVDGYDIQVMALTVPTLANSWALEPSSFGLALSAVVIGLTVGSGLLGPLADSIGRRTMLMATMLIVGLATALTATAHSPAQFVCWRLMTGLALGASIPSCVALTSEYAPASNRSFVMGLLNTGSPIGAFAAGFVAPPLLDAFGWRATFLVGGALPLALAGAAALIPESLKFLLTRRPTSPQLAVTLARIAPEVNPAALWVQQPESGSRGNLLALLGPALRSRTLSLWTMVGLNLFNLYVLISWLPTLLSREGWTTAEALRGAVLIQAGGVVGGLLMSRCMDRGATRAALATGFCLSAVCLLQFIFIPSGTAWVALLLLLGAGVSGSQLAINILSAAYYPAAVKAAGVSWALVIGGIGAIIGPLAGAWLIELQLEPASVIGLLAIPSLINVVAVALMRREWQAY